MKKKVFATIITGAMLILTCLGAVSCGNIGALGQGDGETDSRDVYALSLVSGIGYLSESEGSSAALMSLVKSAEPLSRPDGISDEDIVRIEEALGLFGSIILDGGISEQVRENTSSDPRFADYKLEMNISLLSQGGKEAAYTLYFNEVATSTETELDHGVEEFEESTIFEGVALFGDELFPVKGERELETEGSETETTISFRTYKNIGTDTPKADMRNYVEVEKSSEQGELEYEYKFVRDGKTVREIELEYEQTPRGAKLSFESEEGRNESSFEIKKSTDGSMVIEYEKGREKGKITVTDEAGGYKLTYSNGFEETLGGK